MLQYIEHINASITYYPDERLDFWYTKLMRSATVYIICGFIGSGKTTFAKRLEKETGAVRITKDEWLSSLVGQDPSIPKFEEYDRKICEISRNIAFQFAKNGVDVIIDEGFWAKSERDEMKWKIQSLGAKAVLYYIDTPTDTMRERTLTRNNSDLQDFFHISGGMFDAYLKHWESPSKEEGFTTIKAAS